MENSKAKAGATEILHPGSCHCGAVRWQMRLPAHVTGSRCNCSICTKTAMTGTSGKPEAFRLLSGEDNLSMYEWGGKISRRYFCKTCGVHCFARGHLAELGGDYVSVNLNALDDVDTSTMPMIYWDGRHDNWHAGPRPTPWPVAGSSSAAAALSQAAAS